jgi:DNA-binding GntR family transcriptional regulator
MPSIPAKSVGKGRGRISGEVVAPVTSLVDFAAQRIRDSILVGDLPPGERVLLDGIATELGISSIPVREALRTIASEGLLIPEARRGYTVAPILVKDLDETYQLRLLLEPEAVRLAVPQLTPADLTELGEEVKLLGEAFNSRDWPSHRIHHRAFHFGIYERCNSKWMLRLTDMLWANSERYQFMSTRIRGQLGARLTEHRRILSACRRGDADLAAELMHDHLNRAGQSVREFVIEGGHAVDSGDGLPQAPAVPAAKRPRKPAAEVSGD